jgi:sugar phosphate isomerase/epimerase
MKNSLGIYQQTSRQPQAANNTSRFTGLQAGCDIVRYEMSRNNLSRRSFLALSAAAPLANSLAAKLKNVPVGLELFSVRNELKTDLMGTVRGVAKMGYQGVEFFSPYMSWTPEYTKDVRKLLDELKIKCFSTHNGARSFTDDLSKAIELNSILGSKYIVMASAGRVQGIDGWKKVAETLSTAADKMKSAKLGAGFHNHQVEFRELEGQRPIEVLAANTPKNVMLQFDVGTCVEVGYDPVAWIDKNPGRIKSIHLKEYSRKPGEGYKVLLGEGDAPWKKIFEAAEKTGGVEYYLIEQEGSRFPEMETAERCLAEYKKLHV